MLTPTQISALWLQGLGEYGALGGATIWSQATRAAKDLWAFGTDHMVLLILGVVGIVILDRFLR